MIFFSLQHFEYHFQTDITAIGSVGAVGIVGWTENVVVFLVPVENIICVEQYG